MVLLQMNKFLSVAGVTPSAKRMFGRKIIAFTQDYMPKFLSRKVELGYTSIQNPKYTLLSET